MSSQTIVRDLIVAFSEFVGLQQRAAALAHGASPAACDRVGARAVFRRDFACLDRSLTSGQWTGYLMVDLQTGEIFGIKGYGRVHRGHRYGTLMTIQDFDWGGFYPVRRAA